MSRRKKVAIVFNCQYRPLVNCLRATCSNLSVDGYHLYSLSSDLDEFVKSCLSPYDVVICQSLGEEWGLLASQRLPSALRDVHFLPPFYFDGFHPDTVSVESGGLRAVTFTGDYHSRICVVAFLKGYSPRAAALLYNALIFDRLGYFTRYREASSFIVQRYLEFGVDISLSLKVWESKGCFMHSINHPKTFVLMDIIRIAAKKMGICEVDEISESEIVPDTFQLGPKMPVYPEIAKRLGIEGSRLFRAETDYYARRFSPLGYYAYISACYKVYRKLPQRDLMLVDGFDVASAAIPACA